MTEQDKKPFAMIMGGLGAAYRVDVSKETMAVFFRYLINFPLEAVRYAVDQVITHDERFPSVKRIRELANSYRPSIAHLIPKIDNLLPEFSEADDVTIPSSPEEADEFFKQILAGFA